VRDINEDTVESIGGGAEAGFSFTKIPTLCPTGWFVETEEAPDYLDERPSATQGVGVVEDVARNRHADV
jgi:hypothetical protein